MEAAMEDCDGIIHLAAVSRVGDAYDDPFNCIESNIMGTAIVLEAARKTRHQPWLMLSSTGEALTLPNADANLYGITKYSAEQCARRYAKDYGLRVLITRFSDVYGSGRDHPTKVLPLFIEKALRSEPIVVQNSWMKSDFIYYQDLISGVIRGVAYLETQKKGTYKSISICTGNSVTLVELAETIVSVTGSSSVVQVKDHQLPGAGQESLFEHTPDRALEMLGFQAQVSLIQGIKQLTASIRVNN
jgi:dTDP-glucose 4,6-dehydratase/UDP-glucose 4-epimerase